MASKPRGLQVLNHTIDAETERQARDEEGIALGQWYWVDDREEDEPWLGCVTDIGSNYAQISGPKMGHSQSYSRVHFDQWDEVVKRELDPELHIQGKIDQHRDEAERLMGEIKQLTAALGLVPVGQLTDAVTESSTALVAVHGARDVKAHKRALIKAKEKTLPELFKQIENEHEAMSGWMRAAMLPMKAEQGALKAATNTIEDRIFTVELYAGLCEDVKLIRKGEPASNDEKVHLFQRRHYMDEESLIDYQAGGMDFNGIRSFDRWIIKKANRTRLLPLPKCVVAFQVRRDKKDREANSISDFISFSEFERADETTYLYIRNGDRVWRLTTEIKFGHELFPDAEHARLLSGGRLWISRGYQPKPITEAEYEEAMARERAAEQEYKDRLAAWKAATKEERKEKCWAKPWKHHSFDRYEPLTPKSLYYDDAMAEVTKQMQHHNRIATVIQGLLDRSEVFHPHPPWQLWTPEGFSNGIEMHYDESRALVDGDPLDFERYRKRLNRTIKAGTRTVGQEVAWERHEAAKENERQDGDWRIKNPIGYRRYRPYGNPGPGLIADVVTMTRKGMCSFKWWRERLTYRHYGDNSDIRASFRCPRDQLLNVDAYRPGDFKQFYQDPRTRAQYLKWAPLMLAAEDWHAGKGRLPDDD